MWATWPGTEASVVPVPPGAASAVATSSSRASEPNVRWSAKTIANSPCVGMLDVEAHALVAFRGGARRTQQQLSAHAQVGDEGLRCRLAGRVGIDGDPEELAAAGRALEDTPGQRGFELRCRTGVARERPLVQHRHTEHEGSTDRGIEAGADDFDLGQFRHAR